MKDYESALRTKAKDYLKRNGVSDGQFLEVKTLAHQAGVDYGTLWNFINTGRSLKINNCYRLMLIVDPFNTVLRDAPDQEERIPTPKTEPQPLS